MTSKQRLKTTLSLREPDKMVVDFGSTGVTGIHVLAVERLRKNFGFEWKPVKVTEPYQMLGEVDDELLDAMGVDVIGAPPRNNMFGVPDDNYKPFRTFWGQEVLMPGNLNTRIDESGDLVVYPGGDTSVPPSGKMPRASYFFDTIIRQPPIDESALNPEDNLEEFAPYSEEDIAHWKGMREKIAGTDKGVVLNPGGTALGDIALVPGPFMKDPKGIRDISEWYMSTMMRADYLHEVFDRQTDIALQNLATIFEIFGNSFEAVYMCGTDFGTQESTFCSPETFIELYKPYYRKMNDWIHEHTEWKTFKHSCGAVKPFIDLLADAGFDIINPVQINARGMDPGVLKEKYGHRVTFWGGGVDTQKMLPYGTPSEVRDQVIRECEILSRGGGFVFNTVHNIQANVSLENMVAMLDAIREFNGN